MYLAKKYSECCNKTPFTYLIDIKMFVDAAVITCKDHLRKIKIIHILSTYFIS